jgi:DNA-binding NarL/FixJ family response regulator
MMLSKNTGERKMGLNRASALIVTGVNSLQNGLLALTTAMPQLEVVDEAGDASMALRIVDEHRPDLVLLDADLPGNQAWAVLKHIKAGCPHTHCIVLADDVQQQKEAETLGADAVVLKGTPPAKLVAAIEGLLPRPEA